MADINWGVVNDYKANRSVGTNTLMSLADAVGQQYQNQFAPLQTRIARIAAGSNAGEVVQRMQQAGTEAGAAVDSSEAGFRRQLANAGGVAETDAMKRRFGLRRVLEQVNSMNLTSRSARDQQEAAQQYGLNATISNTASAAQILSGIAGSEIERQSQYNKAKAQQKANQFSFLGQIAGAGIGLLGAL